MTFDWTTGAWRAAGAATAPDLRITVASDWGPRGRRYEPRLIADPEGIYGDLLPLLRESDLNVANVESVLGDAGQATVKDGPNLRGAEGAVASLARAPFRVACLANNHAMDYGARGLAHTMSVLQGAGLHTVGAGLSEAQAKEPLALTVHGCRIAIVNCAEGEEARARDGGPGAHGLEGHATAQQVAALAGDADFVLVIYHGGREYTPVPPPYVVSALRALAEAGAGAVVAHHPHVPQGIEVWDSVPIAYSQGNFVFWQASDLFFQRAGYLVHLDLCRRPGAGWALDRLALSPYLLGPECLALMRGAVRKTFLGDLARAAAALRDPQDVLAVWDAFIDYNGGPLAYWRDVAAHVEALAGDPGRHAPWLLNRLRTEAHRALYLRATQRLIDGTGAAPAWARALVDRWRTLRLDEVL